ncbi:MAG: RidA family protein [Chloroflexota bacterium]|nr:RidA family protein [Chloroflexota bacterium]MDE2886110.1 RidA family protein [Chloroflexota bacterium]
MKEVVYVENGQSHATGPDAVKANGFIYLAAIRGVNPATGACDTEDVGQQTRYAMENIKTALAAAGATMDDIVRVGLFMLDMNDRRELGKVYNEYFTEGNFPVRFAVGTTGVGGGPGDLSRFTMEVIAADPNA